MKETNSIQWICLFLAVEFQTTLWLWNRWISNQFNIGIRSWTLFCWPKKMMKIFKELKSSLLDMGICHWNKQNANLILTKNIVVSSILGLWCACLFSGTIASEISNVRITCFLVFTTCLFNITSYAYILCHKSDLMDLTDEFEASINESKILVQQNSNEERKENQLSTYFFKI